MSVEEVLNRIIERPASRVPAVGEIRRTAFIPIVRALNEASREITFIASTERVDRYGDIIRVNGWQTKEYMKNPVVLWSHKSTDLPIGKTVNLTTETNPQPALVQTVQFADAATYAFADTVYNLYRNGFLKSVSVGFRPLVPPTPIMDPDGDFSGYEFNGTELLELSCVPLPANPDAVARAVEAGIVTYTDASHFFKSPEPTDPAERETLREIFRRIDALEAKMVRPTGEITSLEELFHAGAEDSEHSITSLDELDAALRGGK
jgi:HK97 family phage prohead protease